MWGNFGYNYCCYIQRIVIGLKVVVVYDCWIMFGFDWLVKYYKDGLRLGFFCQNIDVSLLCIGYYYDILFDYYNKKDYIVMLYCSYIYYQCVLLIKIFFMFY